MFDSASTQPIPGPDAWSTADDRPIRRTVPCLTVAWHPEPSVIGSQLILAPGRTLTLGRGGDELGSGMLEDRRLSRRHAEIVNRRGTVRVRDLCSLNGTRINGQSVTDTVARQGDRIDVGSVLFVVCETVRHAPSFEHDRLVGASDALRRVVEAVERVGPYGTTVLVQGESGTGKELVTRSIHEVSGRRGLMLMVNCGGMPDTLLCSELFGHARGAFSGADKDRQGLIEAAAGGTLLLDEIGDASPQLQASLLRFLQEGEIRLLGTNRVKRVDTRVIAATHRDLRAMVAAGEFREDLYARLSSWTIAVPPLRERPEDVAPLARHFARMAGSDAPMSRSLVTHMLCWSWPRNVRELETVIRRAVIESGGGQLRLTPALEAAMSGRANRPASRAKPRIVRPSRGRTVAPDAETLRTLLERSNGNVRRVAHTLGVARTTAYRWIKAAGLEVDSFRGHRPSGQSTHLDFGDGQECTTPSRPALNR